MNEFEERYVSFSTHKLLKIVENAKQYQVIAVEAAKAELSTREISEEDIRSFKNEMLTQKNKAIDRQRQINEIEFKAKDVGNELLQSLNPVRSEPQTIDERIKLIAIVCGLVAVYQLYQGFDLLRFMFVDSGASWGIDLFFYILPTIVLPLGVFFFWRRNKAGWILLIGLMVYYLSSAIGWLLYYWIDENDFVFTIINPIAELLYIIFFGLIIYVFLRTDMRDVFLVDKTTAMVTIGVTIFLAVYSMSII